MKGLIDLYEQIPIQTVIDGCIISRRADVTVGWELTLPVLYSCTEANYDLMLDTLHQAAKLLPPWTVIHRQDVYTYRTYGEPAVPFRIDRWYKSHFIGRRYLTCRSYLWLSFSTKNSALRSNSQTAAFGPRFRVDLPTDDELSRMEMKASEFEAVLGSCGLIGLRRVTTEELEGTDLEPGIIDHYLRIGREDCLSSDYIQEPEKMTIFGDTLVGYTVCDSEHVQNEVSNVLVADRFGSDCGLYLSLGSAVGVQLDCEHVVNQYILMPDQQMVLRDVESRRKRMVSMSQDDRNRLGAGELQEFKDTVHTDSVMMCYTHLNVLAWTSPDKVKEIRGKIVPALGKTMGCVATESYHDLPSLFFAGCPGGACEVGVSNYMLQALKGTLCFGIYEGFEEGLPGGNLLLSDRFRNVPVRLDLGTVAKRYHLIDNYNIFLLGPSGSGKSYFTNFFLRQSYQAGEWNFVIDIGGSYEGLCQIIRELSGGADGAYMSWDENHRISFNPFVGYENWLVDGCLQMEEGGAPFFVSLIKTMWKPKGGWTTDNEAILYSILADFLRWIGPRLKEGALPVFDDFYRFLGKEIQPRIVPKYDKQGNIKAMPSKPYVVAYNPVLLEEFNIVEMLRSLMNYASDGMYGFLLNDPNPADLFTNRFTVFEVKRLSESGDDVFYSVCVLCITGAFDIRMRRGDGFKRLVIDEAWKAIMNETMAPYLRSLWKTARKYSTSAMVVTQELDDIRSSEVIRDTIIGNSDIKILLNQQKNAEKFDVLQEVMGLNEHQKHLILSMMKGHDPRLPYHTDVYIGYLNRYGVFSVEGSAQEAKAYESEFEAKRPVFEKAKQVGSMVKAIEEITGFVDKCDDYEEKDS